MRSISPALFFAALALSVSMDAQESIPDDTRPLPKNTPPPATPATIDGAETFFYREGDVAPMRLHVVKPKNWAATDRRPALIHFFGGGFIRGTPVQSAGWARIAARWGMVGIAPDYRTSERFKTDAIASVADARAALRWAQTHADELGIDPARIVVSGSSAGGHLALWTAIAKNPPGSDPAEAPLAPPAALILFSAAADTSKTSGLRGDRFSGQGDACSPLHNLDEKMPPVLMFHGDADTTVPYAHAVALHRRLTDTGNRCDFVTIPGGLHNFSTQLPEWKEKAQQRERAFLKELKLLPAVR
jgi:acetyl esterase